ncbi:YfbU family protein [Aureimonas altamirensis]|uniref:YfbU family protein n=1 Tax=Aureimonas altamirensis TaxID=370622 RepID=UPI002552612E|nr:YfbU family protein [Aureimonas altamirensis]
MPKLNFTPEQRFILMMIADLYREPEDRELDPKFVTEALIGGHDWALDWNGVLPEEIASEDDVRYVMDVLDTWRFIEEGWARLSPEEQQQVQAAVPHLTEPKFTGFDGNNEGIHLSIARMFIDQMGNWAEFKGRSLNSHHPTRDRYEEMVATFRPMREHLHTGSLTADQLIEILSR